MKKIAFLLFILLGLMGNYFYTSHKIFPASTLSANSQIEYEDENEYENEDFTCDGREYCSQMTSCEEAIFFIQNCPNTKMDGDHDGIPCERQWCN